MDTGLSDKLAQLANELSHAKGVKEAARIRSRCTLEQWARVLNEAKRIYLLRQKLWK